MDCLSTEQMVRYLRGNGDDPRALEGHVRECPACAMDLLLARETLRGVPVRAARPKAFVPRRRAAWTPWAAAAAAAFIALLVFALQPSRRPPAAPPVVMPPAPRPDPRPAPDPVRPEPRKEEPLVPAPPKPEPPRPAPAPEPERPAVPVPVPRPAPVEPKPEPKRPAPTVVERAVVARVSHAVGAAAGKPILAGDTVVAGRQEFLAIDFEGFGALYLRENSRLELGAAGAITLHEGELVARLARRPGVVKAPSLDVDLDSDLFALHVTKGTAELSVLGGKAASGGIAIQGPMMMHVKTGKTPEARPLEPGFAGWIPDKLASRKFMAWVEGESFQALNGFRSVEQDGTSGDRAAVQVEDRAVMTHKLGLPFKARHAVWIRARQYAAKPVVLGILTNGQQVPDLKLEGAEGRPWRWIGPLVVNSDRLDLAVTALSRYPLRENDERRSFPVVIDAALVTSDLKFVPPDRLPEDRKPMELVLEAPTR